MAREAAAVICRNLTQGQLTAVLLVKVMAAKAARGDRFATNFMAVAEKRQWKALAAMASLLSSADTAPSPSDFRYAVPRDALLLSLKICCALLGVTVLAAGSLWLFERGVPEPVPIVGVDAVAAAKPSDATAPAPVPLKPSPLPRPPVVHPPRPHPPQGDLRACSKPRRAAGRAVPPTRTGGAGGSCL